MSPKNNSSDIRIVKKKKGHAGHHGGAWKVAYADFVTALMAFFLVMWITGQSQEVKAAVAGYFKDPQGFMEAVKAGNAPFDVPGSQGKEAGSGKNKTDEEIERAKFNFAKKSIEKTVASTPQLKKLQKHVDIRLSQEGMKIDLMEAKQSLFFDAASAKVSPDAKNLLSAIAKELKKLPNKVIIEGHTDRRPVSRPDYSNWELSADRANSARRIMEAAGMRDAQIAQVRGYAATQPRDPKNPTHYSNRRVSIILVFKDAENRKLQSSKHLSAEN